MFWISLCCLKWLCNVFKIFYTSSRCYRFVITQILFTNIYRVFDLTRVVFRGWLCEPCLVAGVIAVVRLASPGWLVFHISTQLSLRLINIIVSADSFSVCCGSAVNSLLTRASDEPTALCLSAISPLCSTPRSSQRSRSSPPSPSSKFDSPSFHSSETCNIWTHGVVSWNAYYILCLWLASSSAVHFGHQSSVCFILHLQHTIIFREDSGCSVSGWTSTWCSAAPF